MGPFHPQDHHHHQHPPSDPQKPNLFHQPQTSSSSNSASFPTDENQSSTSTSTRSTSDPFFRMRINNIDHVFEQRSHLDRSQSAFSREGVQFETVPVIRIFGSTPLGQRVCLHVHDVFPYCYVEYNGSLEPQAVLRYISNLGRQLNQACLLAMNRTPEKLTTEAFIVAIHLCKGTPFYGYHLGWKYFLKISFRDPKRNSMLARVLESGNLMNGTKFQPYEIHVRYLLQFFLDYNLYGCGYIDLKKCLFRESLPDPESNRLQPSDPTKAKDFKNKFWDSSVIPPNSEFMNDEVIRKVSFADLEVDTHASWIENRKHLSSRSHQHQEIYEKDTLKKDEKLVPSLIDLWIKFGNSTTTNQSKDSMSLKPSMTQRPTQTGKGKSPESTNRIFKRGEQHPPGGIDEYNEQRFEERLKQELIRLHNKNIDAKDLNEDYFLKMSARNPGVEKFDKWISTTYDSVTLFHDRFRRNEQEREEEKERIKQSQIRFNGLQKIKLQKSSKKSSPQKLDQEKDDNPLTPDRIDTTASQRSSGHRSNQSQPFASQGSNSQDRFVSPSKGGQSHSSPLSQLNGIGPFNSVQNDIKRLENDEDFEFDDFNPEYFGTQAFQDDLEKHEKDHKEKLRRNAMGEQADDDQDDLFEDGFVELDLEHEEQLEQERNDEEIDAKLSKSQDFRKEPGTEDSRDDLEDDEIALEQGDDELEEDDLEFEDENEEDMMALDEDIERLVTPSKKRPRASPPSESASKARFRLTDEARFRSSSSPSSHTPPKSQNHFLPSPFHTPSPSSRGARKVKPLPSSIAAISSSASYQESGNASTLPSSSPPRIPQAISKPLPSTLKNASTIRKERPAGFGIRFAPEEKSPPSSPIQNASSGECLTSSDEINKTVRSMPSQSLVGPSFISSNSSSEARFQNSKTFQIAKPPPTLLQVQRSFETNSMHSKLYQSPYFSDPNDLPTNKFVYADREFDLGSKTLVDLKHFDPMDVLPSRSKRGRLEDRLRSNDQIGFSYKSWQISKPPPSRREIEIWRRRDKAEVDERVAQRRHLLASQVGKKSQKLSADFKTSQRGPAVAVDKEKQHMTILALEVFVAKAFPLLPDPLKDPITAICWSFQNEDEETESGEPRLRNGMILLDQDVTTSIDERTQEPVRVTPNLRRLNIPDVEIELVDSELDMFNSIITVVRELDPEILAGWEIHNGSWGYLFERAHHELGYDVVAEIGRVRTGNTGKNGGKGDTWGYTKTSMFRVTGRHILNVWRLMRGELNLNLYTLENVAYELLRTRLPKFSHQTLTEWYASSSSTAVVRSLNYHVERVKKVLEIIEKSELVFRTAEFARIYGIDFFSVLSRGSQFKVESVMFRIAKPESYLLPSPTPAQVATQNAAACIPLIFEPESAFFTSPVLVLDFQSLYPSIMIAYNLCYSTFLGRIDKFNDEYKIGYTKHDLPAGLLTFLQDDVTIDPNGNMFVKPHVRMSLLSKMLGEILDTRVMIKASMKGAKGNKSFQRLQHARQLSLKLLANVTYGYTSASFSGRMPCVEIADAIVQFGRRTLEEAIETIKRNPDWGAVTVYGDTDSLFVHLEGKTKDEAFKIGNEIAEVVTSQNPHPVRLKFEKVYLPSVLLAKKRYVGWKFESPEDQVPVFDAKGIETVRRDGFPALQRMVQSVLEILFQTQDLSAVKSYCQRQWRKIQEGRVSVKDFIIAKEVRLGSYKETAVPPPGAAVAARLLQRDHRAEPQHAERVPYVISQGAPKSLMNDRAVPPDEMLQSKKLRLDTKYYIEKGIIPPLKRIFNLVGCDVDSWFKGKAYLYAPTIADMEDIKVKVNMTDHFKSNHCLICGIECGVSICIDCRSCPSSSTHKVLSDLHLIEKRHEAITKICASCSLFSTPHQSTPCISLDCSMLYTKHNVESQMKSLDHVLKELDKSLPKQEILIEEAWK